MKKRILKQIASFTLVLATVFVLVVVPMGLSSNVGIAQAQPGQSPDSIFNKGGYLDNSPLPRTDLRALVVSVVNILLGVIGIIFLLFILYGGFMWMTAAGSEERADKAQKIIGQGVIGLIVIFVSFALVTFIFNLLGEADVNAGF